MRSIRLNEMNSFFLLSDSCSSLGRNLVFLPYSQIIGKHSLIMFLRGKIQYFVSLVVTKLIFPVSLVFCYPLSSFKKFKLMLRDRLFTTQSSIPGFVQV